MRSMRSRLVIPARLTVTALLASATSGCPSPPVTDAGNDVVVDTAVDIASDTSQDVAQDTPPTPCDAQAGTPGVLTCLPNPRMGRSEPCNSPRYVCTASECEQGCTGCEAPEFDGTAVYCIARAGADAGTGSGSCPGRICNAADCPAHCSTCVSPLFCIPDSESDVMVTTCMPSSVCNAMDCQLGCRAVG